MRVARLEVLTCVVCSVWEIVRSTTDDDDDPEELSIILVLAVFAEESDDFGGHIASVKVTTTEAGWSSSDIFSSLLLE